MTPDLDAYFERIGYAGPREATLGVLRALHAGHTCSIPFENLSPYLGEAVPLDPASLEDKLVRRRRGGWCFEHNLYFSHVLRALGFEVTTLAARVRWNVPVGVITSRSHMLMLVTIDGERYVSDVGFGGLTLTTPLLLVEDLEQRTPHEPHRFVREGDAYQLQALIAARWQTLYVFELHEHLQADYEVSNWYLAHHPGSLFVNGLIAARADGDRRHALRNASYAIHHAGGETERRTLRSLDELKAVLRDAMRIPLPAHPDLDERLQQIVDSGIDR